MSTEHHNSGSLPVASKPSAPMPVVRRDVASSVPSQRKSGPAATNGQGLTPAFVLRVLASWWPIVVPAGVLLAVGAGAVVWYLHEPQFESSAQLKIEATAPFIVYDKATFNRNPEAYVQTQIQLLRGPKLMTTLMGRRDVSAIEEISSQADPVKYLQKNVAVRQVGRSELYEVSFACSSPSDAQTVVNNLVGEYLELQLKSEKRRTHEVLQVLEDDQDRRDRAIKRLRDQYVSLAKQVTGRDPFGQGAITDITAFSPASSLFHSLTEAEVTLEVLDAEIQVFQHAPAHAEDPVIATGRLQLEIAGRPDIRRLQERVAVLQDRLTQIKSRPRTKIGEDWSDDPVYVETERLLAESEKQLGELEVAAGQEFLEMRRVASKAERDQVLKEKQSQRNALAKRREMLQERFNEQMAKLKEGGAQSAELELLRAQLQREQTVFERVEARKLAIELEQQAPARVSLEFAANLPKKAMETIPYKMLAIACLGALVCPFALVVGHEAIQRRIRNPDQLLLESELPILGEIATFPVKRISAQPNQLSTAKQREMFIFAESIDGLRTNMMLTGSLGRPGDPRIIAVCSACSGEGKTSVATSLAMSIAEASKFPTLIIDADLRDPDVADALSTKSSPGLAEVLTDEANIGEAVHRIGNSYAYVLPAGKHRVNPHHILHGDRISDLFDNLRKRFATIIVDTPPVLSASESLVYARAADLTLYCSLADVSRSGQVRLATERLRTTGAMLAGAVLSGVPYTRYVYHYGSYARHESHE